MKIETRAFILRGTTAKLPISDTYELRAVKPYTLRISSCGQSVETQMVHVIEEGTLTITADQLWGFEEGHVSLSYLG